jgi:DNA invertase Pin-like site-specific DNA recombinase
MPKKVLAIANYRVSSDEQLKNGSLGRQERSVQEAANVLGAEIIRYWSGSVSSKKWSNFDREDLLEMLHECKMNPNIKYAIFDELDRFMRSMLELAHFIVEFKKLGVEVKFASQPNLKSDTAADTLLLMLEAFKAEGSNEERQRKSISGHNEALLKGRYTFHPKPGYKRGYEKGVHEIHEVRGPILKHFLISIATRRLTPTQALIELNKSDFMKGHAPYKMDKYRKIVTD